MIKDGGKSAQEEAEVGFEDDDDDEAVVEEDMGVQEEDDEEEAVVEDEDDEFEHFQVREMSKLVRQVWRAPGGAATCSEGFVILSLKVPPPCLGSMAAAV